MPLTRSKRKYEHGLTPLSAPNSAVGILLYNHLRLPFIPSEMSFADLVSTHFSFKSLAFRRFSVFRQLLSEVCGNHRFGELPNFSPKLAERPLVTTFDRLLTGIVNIDLLFAGGNARQKPSDDGGAAGPFPRMPFDRFKEVLFHIELTSEECRFILHLNSEG